MLFRSGWYTTEIGRQPWMVQGLQLVADAAGPVPGPQIALTLMGYLLLYVVLLTAYVAVLFRLAKKAGAAELPPPTADAGPRPAPQAPPLAMLEPKGV